VKGSKKSN